MSSNAIKFRTLILRLTIILSCWIRTYHSAFALNVTVQDTDPSIVYQPPELWHSSSDSCSSCLNPGFSASYHEAIHPDVTSDEDDSLDFSSVPSTVHSTHLLNSPPAPTVGSNDDDHQDADDHDDRKDGKDEGHSGKGRKRSFSRGLIPRLDADDPGFVDPLITFSFNFTGTAIYLFGMQPLGMGRPNEPPTNMNLTFTLDNKPAGVFHSTGVPSASGFRANTNVLSMTALEDGAHQLLVSVGRNSTFLFDHLVYTTSKTSPTSTTDSPATLLGQNSPSSSVSPSTRKHNIATFAGAVGGSVGVLAVFSLCLALSIIRRRRLAAIRDRRDRESLYTSGSDDAPHMVGPAPFVPRYFPGTVIPPDPPTYTAALASSRDGSTLSASISSTRYSSAPRSYADIPPSTPPPLLDEADMIPPPPPFPVAIRSPPAGILQEGSQIPSIPGREETSHNTAIVGVDHSNSAVAPERVPLLQSSDSDSTRRLPPPSGRPADAHETLETNSHPQRDGP